MRVMNRTWVVALCLSVCLFVCLFVCLSVCLSVGLSEWVSCWVVRASPTHMSWHYHHSHSPSKTFVCLFVCLFVCWLEWVSELLGGPCFSLTLMTWHYHHSLSLCLHCCLLLLLKSLMTLSRHIWPNVFCHFRVITSTHKGDGRLCFCRPCYVGIGIYVYVCEQLPGANLSPIVTKLHQSYPWPQGTRWLNFGRSRPVREVYTLLNALLFTVCLYLCC